MNTTHPALKHLPPVPEGAAFRVAGTTTVNHKPHPFCITPKHVAYASDHCGGMLGEEACKAAPCGIGRPGSPIRGEDPCHLSYEEHTHDVALVVIVNHDGDLNEVPGLKEWVVAVNPTAKEHGIGGYLFPNERQAGDL
jgi:hypothetical protein